MNGNFKYLTEDALNDLYTEVVTDLCLDVDRCRALYIGLRVRSTIFLWEGDEIYGFVGWQPVKLPTGERVAAETLLYVRRKHRNGSYSKILLRLLEDAAKAAGCAAVVGGASFPDTAEGARRLYESEGFKTTYSFRKELT